MQVACLFVRIQIERDGNRDQDRDGEIKIETERGLKGGVMEKDMGWKDRDGEGIGEKWVGE